MNMLVMGMSERGKGGKRKREEGGKEGEKGEEVLLTFLRVSSASKIRE